MEGGGNPAWIYAVMLISAALLCIVLTPVVRLLASRLDIVDVPDEVRRIHRGRVPRLGGIAVLVALFGSLALAQLAGFSAAASVERNGWEPAWLCAALLMVVGIGVIDDFWQLGPWPKLAVQLLAATCTVVGGVTISGITNPFGNHLIELGPLGTAVTLLWLVGMTNAFNLIDGLDGLATGVALIAAVTIALLAPVQGRPEAALLAAPLTGALLGFLLYNSHPASIFLGDGGAYLIGYSLAVLSILGLQKGPTIAILSVPLLTLGLPILETLVTIQRRYARFGTWGVLRSDGDHIHHRLVLGGMSQRAAVLLLYWVSTTLAGLAVLAVLVGGPGSAAAVVVVAVGCYVGLRRLGYLTSESD